MKLFGWLLLIMGFVWIGLVSFLNPIVTRTGWSDQMGQYSQRESFTREEVFDAMRSVAKTIRGQQLPPWWGGIAMFIGACLWNTHTKKPRE